VTLGMRRRSLVYPQARVRLFHLAPTL
jgi:hypothetical protein